MIKTENKLLPLIQALKIKTLSKELQDYKVKSVKGLQDYICLEGKGYNITGEEWLQKSFWEKGRAILDLKLELENSTLNWTWELNLESEPVFYLQNLSIYRWSGP